MTLAGMYEKQGLLGRAREIYRRLADGDDQVAAQAARQRLRELPPPETLIPVLQQLLARVQSRRRRS